MPKYLHQRQTNKMDTSTASGRIKKGRCNMNYDRYFLHGPRTWNLHEKICFAHCMRWLLNSGGETSKTTCCLNSTLLSHSGHFYGIPGKNANRCPTYLLKWLATCGKFWSSQFCFLIFSKNHTQKTHHQKPTSKTTCCLNSTLLNHSGHFYSIPWKNELIPTHFFK